MHFGKLVLNNVVLYKQAEFDFDYKGITVVCGHNSNVSANASNGSGKSLLFKSLPLLLFTSSPQGIAKRLARGDTIKSTSSITQSLKAKGHDWEISKRGKGKSVAYTIKKDGQDLQFRTIADAEALVEKIVDKTETEFYALDYVDSRRPSQLQFGTATQRLEFFTTLFRLDSFDEMRALINTHIGDLNNQKVVKETLEQEIKSLRREMPDINIVDTGSELARLDTEIQKYEDRAQRLRQQHTEYQVFESHKATRDKLTRLLTTLCISEAPDADEVGEKIKGLTRQINKALSYERYLEDKEEYDKQVKLSSTKFKGDPEKVVEECEKLLERAATLKLELRGLADVEPEDPGVRPTKPKYTRQQLEQHKEKLLTKLGGAQNTLTKTKRILGSSECPTCGSELNVKDMESIVNALNDEVALLNRKLKSVKSHLRKADAYEEYDSARSKYDAWITEDVRRKKIEAQLKDIDTAKIKERASAANRVLNLKKPRVVEYEGDTSAVLVKQLDAWKSVRTLVTNCYDVSEVEPVDVSKLKRLESKVAELRAKQGELKPQLVLAKSLRKRIQAKRNEVAQLDQALTQLDLLLLLKDAYSAKGLKMMIVARLAARIEQNLNRYSPLIFRERMTFSLSVRPNSFDILVDRMVSGKRELADVRVLSGAESRAFSLLFLLSVLPLIPKERRSNVLVLDECDANLDTEYVKSFTHDFIPKLSQIIPHVIVITPRHDLDIKGARVLDVHKRRNQSTLNWRTK